MTTNTIERSVGRNAFRAAAIALMIILLTTGLCASAQARTESAASGSVSATVSYASYPQDGLAELTIQRDGRTIIREEVSFDDSFCSGPDCRLVGAYGSDTQSLFVKQIDESPDPEIVLYAFTGGANCCLVIQVWKVLGDLAAPVAERSFGKAGFRFRDLDGNGIAEFWSGDSRFAYRFSSGAASGYPLRVLAFAKEAFSDVTRSYPEAINLDARRWWRLYEKKGRTKQERLGALAAWAADQYLLGRRAQARRVIRREIRAGRAAKRTMLGRLFLRDLTGFLSRLGY